MLIVVYTEADYFSVSYATANDSTVTAIQNAPLVMTLDNAPAKK